MCQFQELELLTHVLLVFLYADPCQLGRDPSMKLLDGDENEPQYEMTLLGEDGRLSTYRTLELLSDKGVRSFSGKGTRVWRAAYVDANGGLGPPVIVKDAWVNANRTREGAILEQLYNMDDSPEFQKSFKAGFLTLLNHGDVVLEVHEDQRIVDQTWTQPARTRDEERTPPPHTAHSTDGHGENHLKVHYRIVFEEVCTPLYQDASVSDVFRRLGQVCAGTCVTLCSDVN